MFLLRFLNFYHILAKSFANWTCGMYYLFQFLQLRKRSRYCLCCTPKRRSYLLALVWSDWPTPLSTCVSICTKMARWSSICTQFCPHVPELWLLIYASHRQCLQESLHLGETWTYPSARELDCTLSPQISRSRSEFRWLWTRAPLNDSPSCLQLIAKPKCPRTRGGQYGTHLGGSSCGFASCTG